VVEAILITTPLIPWQLFLKKRATIDDVMRSLSTKKSLLALYSGRGWNQVVQTLLSLTIA